MKANKMFNICLLGKFYTGDTEQYIFQARSHAKLVRNVLPLTEQPEAKGTHLASNVKLFHFQMS